MLISPHLKKTPPACLALFTVFLSVSSLAGPQDIYGIWITESANGKVEVKDCGDSTPCGTLIWVDESQAESAFDIRNSDPKLRTRPLIGSAVFWGFKSKGDKWKSGKIYDAESGKTYKSKMEMLDNGTLKVKGCIGPICQSQIWTRVPAN